MIEKSGLPIRYRKINNPKPDTRKGKGSMINGCKQAAALRELNVHKPVRRARLKDVKAMRALKDSLRETWSQLVDRAQEFKNYTEKQQRFARFYALNGRSNKCGAMRDAGYTDDHKSLLEMANRYLKYPGFTDLIRAYELEEKARMKLTVEDVVKWFQDIAAAAMETQDFTNANRAMENLAKYLQMFVERREVTHRVVHSKQELDARIAELTAVLREAEPEIEQRLRIN
jgi:acyl carrier protein phosphodiesterase